MEGRAVGDVPPDAGDEIGAAHRLQLVNHRLAVGRRDAVDINQRGDTLRRQLGNPRNNHPGVSVSHQDGVLDVVGFQQPGDVADMQIQVERRRRNQPRQMRPLAQPR